MNEIIQTLEAFFWLCGIGFLIILSVIIAICLAEKKNDSGR